MKLGSMLCVWRAAIRAFAYLWLFYLMPPFERIGINSFLARVKPSVASLPFVVHIQHNSKNVSRMFHESFFSTFVKVDATRRRVTGPQHSS